MEEEERLILAAALVSDPKHMPGGLPWSLGEAIRMIFGPENGVDLNLLPDEPIGDPLDLGWPADEDREEAAAGKAGR